MPDDDVEAWIALVALMDRLRGPGGCPWDREQTMANLKTYLLEEAYEVVEAVDSGQAAALREELGDLLFQVLFLSRIAKELGWFEVHDVVRGIREKMIRRHPHVFGDSKASTSGEVLKQWEEIKRSERPEVAEHFSALKGVPRSLPALLRAQRLSTKAARVGFDWNGPDAVLEKIEEETCEVRAALEEGGEASMEEIGDLLFAVANLARHVGVDPEGALQKTNEKFTRRFQRVEALLRDAPSAGRKPSIEEMERLWEKAKAEERQSAGRAPVPPHPASPASKDSKSKG